MRINWLFLKILGDSRGSDTTHIPLEFILPLLYSKVLGEVERTHNDFNEFSSHPWHILLGSKLLIIIIIHELLFSGCFFLYSFCDYPLFSKLSENLKKYVKQPVTLICKNVAFCSLLDN